MSNEKGLSAECIACDRAGSHGKHGSASMLMAWRSAPPAVSISARHKLVPEASSCKVIDSWLRRVPVGSGTRISISVSVSDQE